MSRVWKMTLEELVKGTEGRVKSKVAREFGGVGTDTRLDLTGQIFIALEGDAFDAHDFLTQAAEKGAAALLIHRLPENAKSLLERVTVIEVDDTLKALQKLGNFWRRKLGTKVLGITGTNGKTTTKEFAAAVIGSKRDVHYSKGSLNNHWGVPLSLLAMDAGHEVALIEMGMNHPGELALLSSIAEPDVVVVTMVGRGHLEGLGSIEGVARAKAEIYASAPPHSTLIFNMENRYTRPMFARFTKARPQAVAITFASLEYARMRGFMGTDVKSESTDAHPPADAWPELDVAFEITTMDADAMHIRGEIRGVGGETRVPVFGAQNLTNLMVAATLALSAGLEPDEIWRALPLCHTVWGRNQWVALPSGARVLFDGYNANPESMQAAITNFARLESKGRKFAVLGEMKEMGEHAPRVHRELGEEVARAGFEAVSFFGPSKGDFQSGLESGGFQKTLFVSSTYEQTLAPRMLPVLELGDLVLMKGSRGMALEKALLDLKPLDFHAKK